jgi:hypothetical protein
MKLSIADLQHVLDTYDKGVLSQGAHSPNDGAYCALECVSLARNHGTANFSDSPSIVGIPDLRAINDRLSDSIRTQVLLPLLAALSDWSVWAPARRQRWVAIVTIHTVNRIIAQLPELPEYIVEVCRQANTLTEAQAAAWAARAASATASEASEAAADKVLLVAVNIWFSAVAESESEQS